MIRFYRHQPQPEQTKATCTLQTLKKILTDLDDGVKTNYPKMNSTLQLILKQLKKDLKQLYGDQLINITLFGSQARGDHKPDSDIDVLVVLKSLVNPGTEIKRTGKIVAALSLKYDQVITCLFIDEIQYQTRNNAFLRNIRKEGILL